MPTYRVVRKSDGEEVTRYAAAQVALADQYPLDAFDHIEFDPDAPEPQQPVPTRITKLSFRQRFLQSERVAIEIASLDNPAAPMEMRAQAATLRSYLKDIDAASHVDLNFPATRAGVQMLETVGLIGAGRAAVILDTPPTEDEVWSA